jgi:hypothetical protein
MDDETIFGGVLWDQEEDDIAGPSTGYLNRSIFVDRSALLDVIYFNEPIAAGSLLSQLTAFMDNMAPHGVTLSPDQATGPDLPAQTFAWMTIRECLESVGTQAGGWVYTIDPNGVLEMIEPAASDAPITISEDLGNYRSLKWVINRNAYRNNGLARYGAPGIQLITQTFEGDGANRTYPLSRALILTGGLVTPTGLVTVVRAGPVTSNETTDADTAGTAQWHFDATAGTVGALIHDDGQTALLDNETITISYNANSPGVVTYENEDEVDTYGPYTIVLDLPDVTDLTVALAILTDEVNKRVGLNKRVRLVIDDARVRPGMALPLDIPSRDCEGDFLVLSRRVIEEAVGRSELSLDAGERHYAFELDLVEGNRYRSNWEPFWGHDPGASTGGPTLTPPTNTPTPDYPTIRGTDSEHTTSDTTSHAIGIPTHEVGDLIVVVFANDGSATVSVAGGSTAGWSELCTDLGSVSLVRGSVFTLVAPSASSVLTLTTSSAEQSAWIVYVITVGTFSGVDASTDGGGGTNSDPPNHTPSPGGTPNYLWIVTRCGDSQFVASAPPSSFVSMITEQGTINGASVNTAHLVAAVSSLNPGTWTSSDSVSWVTATIAVWPTGA